MHRVELKAKELIDVLSGYNDEFLMHRVELKVFKSCANSTMTTPVPNAPCGVERNSSYRLDNIVFIVPNAPCGVERRAWELSVRAMERFLMHRVELKVTLLHLNSAGMVRVPNAPCGVESREAEKE